ncbi:MAG: hypothetical protein NC102_05675 [Clostridium sp.]|nr:hypothetical protein [Clostridium sp.]
MQTSPNLLSEVLEIEGLIRILMERDDADVLSLLRQKSAAFAAQILAIQSPVVGSRPGASAAPETAPQIEASSPVVGTHPGASPVPEPAVEAPESAYAAPPQIDIDSDISVNIVEFEEEKAPEPAPAPEPTPAPAPAPKSFITFNEKYRFARELFNNEHALMSDVLAKVSSMQSLAQAHDYVLNDLNLDEDNPVVIEFLEVIARYFNSRT